MDMRERVFGKVPNFDHPGWKDFLKKVWIKRLSCVCKTGARVVQSSL